MGVHGPESDANDHTADRIDDFRLERVYNAEQKNDNERFTNQDYDNPDYYDTMFEYFAQHPNAIYKILTELFTDEYVAECKANNWRYDIVGIPLFFVRKLTDHRQKDGLPAGFPEKVRLHVVDFLECYDGRPYECLQEELAIFGGCYTNSTLDWVSTMF